MTGLAWHWPSSRNCLQQLIGAPLHYVQEKMSIPESTETPKEVSSDREPDAIEISRTTVHERADATTEDSNQNHIPAGGGRVSFRVPVDPMHEEALSILKKLQVAAALTSDRMEEVIHDELNRLEAENLSQLSVMGEIMEDLLNRGDIKQYWEGKMKKEQDREFEVKKHLGHVLHELANERTDREKELPDLLKDRTALERQKQKLISLRSEVDGMYDRLATESLEILADEQNLEKLSSDVSSKHQAVTEAKSYLEAEREALTMPRSWVKEEAARGHERAEVLEKAVRRWRIPAD